MTPYITRTPAHRMPSSPTARINIPGPEWAFPRARPWGIDMASKPDQTLFVLADFSEIEKRVVAAVHAPHRVLMFEDGESMLEAVQRQFPEGYPPCPLELAPVTTTLFDNDAYDEEWEPPSPSTPGDLIFATGMLTRDKWGRVDQIELLEWDYDGAFFWINEGVGIDYFVAAADHSPVVLEEHAVYVCEGLTVRYIRGDGYTTDDDEDWEDYITRPATIDEIAGLFGCDFWNHDEGKA